MVLQLGVIIVVVVTKLKILRKKIDFKLSQIFYYIMSHNEYAQQMAYVKEQELVIKAIKAKIKEVQAEIACRPTRDEFNKALQQGK